MVIVNPWVSVCYDHIINEFQVVRGEKDVEVRVTLRKCGLTRFLETGMKCMARLPRGNMGRGAIKDFSIKTRSVKLVCAVS